MQAHMEEYMRDTNDHALEPFLKRNDRAALAAYIKKVQGEADARRSNKRKRRQKPAPKAGAKGAQLLRLNPPTSASAGKPVTITIGHTIPADLKEQKIHVTLKAGDGKRIERKVTSASGKGTVEVSFDLPATVAGSSINFAVFIGEEYASKLQHLRSKPIALK
jgi:hypothetical protein